MRRNTAGKVIIPGMRGLRVDHGLCQAAGKERATREQARVTHSEVPEADGLWTLIPDHQSPRLQAHGRRSICPISLMLFASSPLLLQGPAPALQKVLTNSGGSG